MELNSKAGEERLNQLDRYFEAVQSVILARQHPVTGLLAGQHGDNGARRLHRCLGSR